MEQNKYLPPYFLINSSVISILSAEINFVADENEA
jgi:hypothetical protein